jgi:ribose 1,5-bisphosphate isomerase
MEVFTAESRAFDGGKPYVSQALKGQHTVKFIPDAAVYYYLRCCDGEFIGSETYYADGKVFNSVGLEMVAFLCNTFDVPFYVLTTLIKIDLRSIIDDDARNIKQRIFLNEAQLDKRAIWN